MGNAQDDSGVTRRQTLGFGAALLGSLALPQVGCAHGAATKAGSAGAGSAGAGSAAAQGHSLPVAEIQGILGAHGQMSDAVLGVKFARKDIGDVRGPLGLTFTPSFLVEGAAYFQPIGQGKAFVNGDMALLAREVNPFIAALLKHGLAVQAFHQHLPMLDPQIWFVHFRGTGEARGLAKGVRAALGETATPLPQSAPQNPTTPLDAHRLASILHGEASVGEEGVVSVLIPRTDAIRISGVHVKPQANISTHVAFKPLGDGAKVAALPDFSMKAQAIGPVIDLMLNQLHWFQGCLYNQETDEHPQLYFDHMLKVGDAYGLAQEIRRGLDRTQARRG